MLLLTVIGLGAAFALGPGDATTTKATGIGLPASAQSAQVAEILRTFPSGAAAPALVVYSNTDNSPLSDAQRAVISERATVLGTMGTAPAAAAPRFVEDKVATVAVVLATGWGDDENATAVDRIRSAAARDLPASLHAEVTGGPAFRADIGKVFAGADTDLLIATASV
ncbi:MMPL family transporter, partial [Kitasatospora sp. NPDC059160]